MRWVRRDDGTVLLWTLGVLIVSVSVLVGLLSLGSFIITQRKLDSLADNASLAAVGSLALQDFIDSGDLSALSINQTKANARIRQILSDSHSRATLESVDFGRSQVTVQLGVDWVDITGQIQRHISAISTADFVPEIESASNL
ncbi:MAG: hypothetical protein RIS43_738 [Actinomycetota bacterium]|jgi:hypothetical protein